VTTDQVAIDDLRPDEVDAAIALWEACDLTRPWNDPRSDAHRAFAGETSTILATREDGRLVATVMVGADGHRGWVYYLAVAPDRRKRGLGEAMMRAAEAWVAARGMPKMQLMVRIENAGAAGFYHAIGYETEERLLLAKRLSDD
jgi:ribosomal protein S18 acetylase RimI-like enzyme